MRENDKSVTPEFSEVVQTLIDATLVSLNVCLPAKIVSYNKDTQYAEVQIQLMQKYEDGSLVKRPIIPNVPVIHPRANAGAAFVHMPLQKGDDVTLIFSQRSLDNWKTQGGLQDPNDRRKFHITDAFALVGGSAVPNAFKPSTDNAIEIVNGETEILVYPNGKVQVKNDTAELIDLMNQLLTVLTTKTFTLTELGPQPFITSTIAEITTIQQKLETLKV